MKSIDLPTILIEDFTDKSISDKPVLIKNKSRNHTESQDSSTVLEPPQFRSNDQVTLIKELESFHQKNKDGLQQQQIKPTLLITPTKADSVDLNIESPFKVSKTKAMVNQTLKINDLDFTDLTQIDDIDPTNSFPTLTPPPSPMVPPPPPPFGFFGNFFPNTPPPPPPPLPHFASLPHLGGLLTPPPPPQRKVSSLPPLPSQVQHLSSSKSRHCSMTEDFCEDKRKLTKLHWKEVITMTNMKDESIWNDLARAEIDKDFISNLFELKHVDFKPKKSIDGKKELIILDTKRSNMIVIGMTALPPPRVLKTAIIKMDNSVINKEGIEKLLTMLPTEEEKNKILEAQVANPDLQLGSAEFFLLNLSSISEIKARLELWVFKLDFDVVEREIAECLMDLKNGMEELKKSKTFKEILRILKEIGNHLNSSNVKGFQLDYLSRVPEVKDTVHKHSLLQHLCSIILEKSPETTDLYSDLGGLSRCSKVDWEDLNRKIKKLEIDCQASWDNLKAIAKNDNTALLKTNNPLIHNLNDETTKLSDFLADSAERIKILQLVHSRLLNRFRSFLLYLGYPRHQVSDYKIKDFCKLISEFALEYKTVRDRLLQQKEKRINKTKPHFTNDASERFGHFDKETLNSYKNDDSKMNEMLTSFDKFNLCGSSTSCPILSGFPGVRSRTRVKPATIPMGKFDSEEDAIDSVHKTIMAVTKGIPPKKRIPRKYTERKGTFRRTLNLND